MCIGSGTPQDPTENAVRVFGCYIHMGRIWQSDTKHVGQIKSIFINVFSVAAENCKPSHAVKMKQMSLPKSGYASVLIHKHAAMMTAYEL